MFYLPDEIKLALKTLENSGYEAYVVGGAVRDMLANRPVHDYDIASSADPYEVLRVFLPFKTFETGLKHGTVTVIIGDYPIEITVFRRDSVYSDGRHPDSVTRADSITEDLSRRDFTVNAMALSLRGEITDPFGGEGDLKAKIIKCVGDPEKRFSEDHLRILRALRFSSELGFGIEENTEKKIREEKELILTVSAERIYTELCRLLEGGGASRVLSSFSDVICLILGIEPNDGYLRTAGLINKLEKDAVLRLAALLSGQTEEKAAETMRRLKAKNADRSRVKSAVKYSAVSPANKGELKKFINEAGYRTAFDVFAIRSLYDEKAKELYDKTKEIFDNGEPVSIKDLAVNGSDLIDAGIAPGKDTGAALEKLLSAVIEDRVKNEKTALIAYARTKIKKKS